MRKARASGGRWRRRRFFSFLDLKSLLRFIPVFISFLSISRLAFNRDTKSIHYRPISRRLGEGSGGRASPIVRRKRVGGGVAIVALPSTKAAAAAAAAAAGADDVSDDASTSNSLDSDGSRWSWGGTPNRRRGASDETDGPPRRPTAAKWQGQQQPRHPPRRQQQQQRPDFSSSSDGGSGGGGTGNSWYVMRAAADAATDRVGPREEAEAAVSQQGFWVQFLDDGLLLPPGTAPGELGWSEAPASAAYSEDFFLDGKAFRSARLTINRILAKATDWRTPLTMARDCGRLLDEIGAACACHRLAKLSSAAGVPLEVLRSHPGFGALSGAVAARVPTFAPRQTANVLWSLGKLGDRASPLLPALVSTLPNTPWDEWREQELANSLWAAGALQLADWPAAWLPLVAEVKRRGLSRFETQAVSNIVWACAYLDARDEELLGAVADSTVAAIAIAARAAAEAEARGDSHAPVFSNPAAARFVSSHDGATRTVITPQSISNTVWALTELDFFHSTAFEAAADDFRRRTRAYKAQEMCNLLYGFAKAGFADLAALAAFDAECSGAARRAQLTGQAVANMLWSFATLKYCPEKSLEAFAGEVAERAGWFGEQELANALWALGRLGYEAGPAKDGDENGDEGGDSYGSGGYGGSRKRRPRLLEAASERVVELAEGFNVQACGNTLWALAVLGGTRMPCFNVLAARMAAEVERVVADEGGSKGGSGGRENNNDDDGDGGRIIESSQINQLFQALLLTKLQRDEATAAAAEAAKASVIAERSGSGASRDEIEAAAAAAAEAAVEAAAADAALPSIPDAVARHVTRRWLQSTQNTVVSVFQEDVAATLRDLGVRHSVEHTTADGLFSVDIAIEELAASTVSLDASATAASAAAEGSAAAAGTGIGLPRKVAIECDGPFHFAINTHAPTGATKLRRRLLSMLGWSVLPLPFFDHYALSAGSERARYLAALLRTAGVEVDPARAPAPADAREVDRVERAFQEKQQMQRSSSSSSSQLHFLPVEGGSEGDRADGRPLTAELIEAAARAAARGEASPIAAPPGSLVVPRQYSEEQAAASAAEAAAAPAPGGTWASAGGGGGVASGGRGGGALSNSTSSSSSSFSLPTPAAEIELTAALIDAARRAAMAVQGLRGPVPRERLAGLGLVLRRDAAMPPSRFVAGNSPSNFSSMPPSKRLGYPGQQQQQPQQQQQRQQKQQWEQKQQQQQPRHSSFERSSGGRGGAGGGYRGNNGGGIFSNSPGSGRGAGGAREQQPFSQAPGRGSGGYNSGYNSRDGGSRDGGSRDGGSRDGGGYDSSRSGGSSWSQSGGGGGGGSSWSQSSKSSSERDFAPLDDWDSFEEGSRSRPPPSRAAAFSPAPLPPPPPSSFDRGTRKLELAKLTVPALGLLATAGGVKRRSGLKKAELVEALLDAEQRQQQQQKGL